MEKIDIQKAQHLLKTLRNFIIHHVLPGDPHAQQEVSEIFTQLDNLLLDYKTRQGG